MSVLTAAAALPFLKPPAPIDIGVPIQVFGMIVAAGVLIGAALLRRYAEWHGVSDEHIRGLTGWITVAGFIGAHEFDVIMYQWDRISDPINWMHISQWPLPLRFWDGISSYGGFVGGAAGFAIYVWWKRLPVRLFADIALVGLMPAFTIGRIGCTVVSDHIGAAVNTTKWYASLAMNYPESAGMGPITNLIKGHPCDLSAPGCSPTPLLTGQGSSVLHDGVVTAWNLGLIEFLWLVPVNAVLLWLAFRTKKRPNAGLIAVLAGLLYSPVRFFLDSLRPEETDPRHLGLTFAQWASIAAFGVAAYVLAHIIKNGAPAEVVAPSSGEAQRRIKMVLKEQAEADAKSKVDVPSKPSEAEDKAAAADTSEGDEGVDDPAPAKSEKPAAKPPTSNKNKRKK